jgi:hypothetical protein
VRVKAWLIGLAVTLIGTVTLVPAPAQAADEWTPVASLGTCQHSRTVSSSVANAATPYAAYALIDICWNDALTDVRVRGYVQDGDYDGYHAEARIRYQVLTSSGWSGWHYRTVVAAYGFGAEVRSDSPVKANQPTRYVQGAACLYNGDTVIDCDDRGWR